MELGFVRLCTCRDVTDNGDFVDHNGVMCTMIIGLWIHIISCCYETVSYSCNNLTIYEATRA